MRISAFSLSTAAVFARRSSSIACACSRSDSCRRCFPSVALPTRIKAPASAWTASRLVGSMATARSSASTARATWPVRRQMQSSELGERFDVVRVQQQRDDELGVSFGLAAVLDVGAAQCPVRRGVVRGRATRRAAADRSPCRRPGAAAPARRGHDRARPCRPAARADRPWRAEPRSCVIGCCSLCERVDNRQRSAPALGQSQRPRCARTSSASADRPASSSVRASASQERSSRGFRRTAIAQVLDAPRDVPSDRIRGREDSVRFG